MKSFLPPIKTVRFTSLAAALLAAVFLFSGSAFATWSIVVVNHETGEVGIGSATCLKNTDLKKVCGVIVVGKGAGQAQASGDSTGENRTTIAESFLAGLTAEQTLAQLQALDPNLEIHQYGLVDIDGGAATFTGQQTLKYTSGLTGKVGPISYAIQGNVLTGEGVLLAAEAALVQTPGDLAEKLMAAMQGAKLYGGDGRCSCVSYGTMTCGCPPLIPKKYMHEDKNWKSAHVGYMVIARIGDQDGEFSKPTGFANGSYYMDLNVTVTTPEDPVDQLQGLFDAFRSAWTGHADHIRSEKTVYPARILADGSSKAELMIHLVDWKDDLILHGGASIQVTHAPGSAGSSQIGAVSNPIGGYYSVPLTASTTPGKDLFQIVVDDGMGPVTLYPYPALELVQPLPQKGSDAALAK